jgi:hypothetical protein
LLANQTTNRRSGPLECPVAPFLAQSPAYSEPLLLELSVNPSTDRSDNDRARSDNNSTGSDSLQAFTGMFLRKKRVNAGVTDVKAETFDRSADY